MPTAPQQFQPKFLSGFALRATQRVIEGANSQRLWNVQSVYNALSIAGPCHAYLARGRLGGKMRRAQDRAAQAHTPWTIFTTTVAHDARRGAYVAATAARPATWMLDALIGTSRRPKPTKTPAVNMLKTIDALGTHFTNTGLLGAILLGAALSSACIGAAAGCMAGVTRGLASAPYAWVTDRQMPWVTVQRCTSGHIEFSAGQAVIANLALLFAQVQLLRLATAALKLGVVAVGSALGLTVGLMHGAAVGYSAARLQPQFRAEGLAL